MIKQITNLISSFFSVGHNRPNTSCKWWPNHGNEKHTRLNLSVMEIDQQQHKILNP